MDKKTEDGEYVPALYDLLVKYNQGVEIPEQVSFIDFWRAHEDPESIGYGTTVYGDMWFLSTNVYDELKYKYTGYLKIAGEIARVGTVVIDGLHYKTNYETTTFYYEGYVKDTIEFTDSALGIRFTEFSINPYELSQDTKDFYSNIPEGNDDAWGELMIDFSDYEPRKIDWYEPIENDEIDKMEFWNHNFVESAPDGSTGLIIDVYVSGHTQPSGEKDLAWSGNNLPILIHENDIGKKNTIGPLKDSKGNEVYIKLTII